MKTRFTWSLLALLFAAAGCSNDHGPDSLFAPRAGAVSAGCVACHNSTSTIAPDPLVTNGSGTYGKHIRHVQDRGIPCDRCHNNYDQLPTHMNITIDTGNPAVLIVYFDAVNPIGLWTSDTGTGTGTCASLYCHSNQPLDWYGTNTWSLPPCDICHSSAINLRRAVTGMSGDFAGNSAIVSHHVTSTADPTPAQCQVCHEMSAHMGGGVRLKHADTGAAIAYDPASPNTLEPFCISCHDTTGAISTFVSGGAPTQPFNNGSRLGTAPYPYAMRIASSWTSTHGHGPNGNHAAASKLTCLGSGQPGTGCHGNNGTINAHGSIYNVIASRNFKYDTSDPFNDADFDLCFNCHASYVGFTKEETLGVKFGGILDAGYGFISRPSDTNCAAPCYKPPYYPPGGVTTLFADHNDTAANPLNDFGTFGVANMNLHWFHLGFPTDFRGTAVTTGVVCVNCHDVHGSSNPHGATYNEIGYRHVFPDAINRLGVMTDAAYYTAYLDGYPTYCAFNCHTFQGVGTPTRAWYYPIVE